MTDGSTFDASEALGSLARLEATIATPAVREIVREQTDAMHADAISRASFGRGVYRAGIREKIFDDPEGTSGVVFATQTDWARKPGTKAPKNLPLWLEYGTRRMDPRPHLIPAFNAARERMNRAMDQLLGKVPTE